MSEILLENSNIQYKCIILNSYGIVISNRMIPPADEKDTYSEDELINQIGMRYEDLDTYILVLQCIRNARKARVDLSKGIWKNGNYYFAKIKDNEYIPLCHIDGSIVYGSAIGIQDKEMKVFPAPTTEENAVWQAYKNRR